jgi:hypothetical protein
MKTLLAGGCLILVLTACATPGPSEATRLADPAVLPPAGCVPYTATRIPVKRDDCAGSGHSFSETQLQSTGTPDTAAALRLLDSALSVSGR